MIVKNEETILWQTLKKLTHYIAFDYWVICDTGSTDKTKKIILDFFQRTNIPGEIFEDPWQDFGTNRTKALEHAYQKTDYVLIWDADDEIQGTLSLPKLTANAYSFVFGDESI